jgi:hypothetical protein
MVKRAAPNRMTSGKSAAHPSAPCACFAPRLNHAPEAEPRHTTVVTTDITMSDVLQGAS